MQFHKDYNMSKIKLSDYLAKRLKEHGVEHFFIVSGGGAMHLNDGLGRAIPYTACHHEQACAMAAEGYARVNQKLAVVNVTTGPGGLNALNGLFGQWTDSVPVLYISGQVKRRTLMASFPELSIRQIGDQEVDIISVVKPLTKYSVCITEPQEIKYHIDKAIYEATTGRKGPVWLDIPIDVQSSIIDENDLKEFVPPEKSTYNLRLEEVFKRLKNAKRPLIIAGHGIRLAGAIDKFKQLTEKLKVPVVTTLNGFDILESDNPYYIGRIGTIGQRAGNFALQNADLILCLGTRNNIRQVSYNWENFGKNAYKIVVDIDSAELKKPLVKPDMAINADLKEFLPEILNKINPSPQPSPTGGDGAWLEFCQTLKEKYSFENHPETVQKDKIEPYHFSYELTKQLKKNDIVVMANATPTITIFQNTIVKSGQRYITNSGDASMGYGLPAAIGAALESPEGNVICLEGDGSIMMNLQELQTVKHYNLPIKLFIIKNNGYSSIRQSQKNFFNGHMTGSGIDSGVSVPDFAEIGKAFGIKSVKINNPKTMAEDIKNVLETKGAVLCEVETIEEYNFVPKLSSRQLPDGSMVSASLEDMFPFLDREEFERNML